MQMRDFPLSPPQRLTTARRDIEGRSAERPRKTCYTGAQTGEPAGKASSRGTCRYLKVSLWHSETMFALPKRGQARLVYLYLLTGPHTLGYHVPGLYQVGKHALREALGLTLPEFSRCVADLREHVSMQTDFERGLIWLPSALEHLGPPANPNIVRGYCRALQSMPKSDLVADAIAAYGPFLETLGRSFVEPFARCFPRVCQNMGEPFAIDKREKKKEKREQIKDRQMGDDTVAHAIGLTSIRAIVESLNQP